MPLLVKTCMLLGGEARASWNSPLMLIVNQPRVSVNCTTEPGAIITLSKIGYRVELLLIRRVTAIFTVSSLTTVRPLTLRCVLAAGALSTVTVVVLLVSDSCIPGVVADAVKST